ncbi:hypothetical protein MHU86_5124 [Fragilaria crotonensis]|nr:hypothetical protein MHU86_5124 [Fragilaria crotonensis]
MKRKVGGGNVRDSVIHRLLFRTNGLPFLVSIVFLISPILALSALFPTAGDSEDARPYECEGVFSSWQCCRSESGGAPGLKAKLFHKSAMASKDSWSSELSTRDKNKGTCTSMQECTQCSAANVKVLRRSTATKNERYSDNAKQGISWATEASLGITDTQSLVFKVDDVGQRYISADQHRTNAIITYQPGKPKLLRPKKELLEALKEKGVTLQQQPMRRQHQKELQDFARNNDIDVVVTDVNE